MDSEIDRLIRSARDGDGAAVRELAGAVYQDFRRLARRFLRGERADHTLQPTALANEVYLRLFDREFPAVESRAEFFVAAARSIRRILIEHARTRGAKKRGGGAARVDLDAGEFEAPVADERLVDLDAALERLAAVDPQKARLVELRFFGGLSVPEVAALLETSERTVARQWRTARAFLELELLGNGPVRAEESADDANRLDG